MGQTWTERHPHPGQRPAKPAEEQPTDAVALHDWWVARHAWDLYVVKLRRHQVATAVDELDATFIPPRPEQLIARILGACWLDRTLTPSDAIFAGIFGRDGL